MFSQDFFGSHSEAALIVVHLLSSVLSLWLISRSEGVKTWIMDLCWWKWVQPQSSMEGAQSGAAERSHFRWSGRLPSDPEPAGLIIYLAWERLRKRGALGPPSSACCHRDPAPEKRQKMEAWMFLFIDIFYFFVFFSHHNNPGKSKTSKARSETGGIDQIL